MLGRAPSRPPALRKPRWMPQDRAAGGRDTSRPGLAIRHTRSCLKVSLSLSLSLSLSPSPCASAPPRFIGEVSSPPPRENFSPEAWLYQGVAGGVSFPRNKTRTKQRCLSCKCQLDTPRPRSKRCYKARQLLHAHVVRKTLCRKVRYTGFPGVSRHRHRRKAQWYSGDGSV